MKAIFSALVKAQRDFGPALKSSTNPHFKSRYADLAACVEAVIDSLNANGIALIQQNHPHPDGVVVETVFIHESGEQFNCGQLFVPASKHDPQGYGSALTYARRYSLMAACGIAPEDDDGNAAQRKPTTPSMPASQLADWIAAIESCTDADSLKTTYLEAYKAAQNDANAQKKIIAAKDSMKGKL